MEEFVQRHVKIYNYSEECKEVIDIESTGFGTKGGRKGKSSNEVSEKDRERNLKRVKRNVRRLALANDLGQIHLVLTYRDNMQDVSKADAQFKRFIFSLHKIYPNLKYLATREFQVRGAIHYHVLLNQRVDYKKVNALWGHGYITLAQHKNKLKAVMYVLKYIQKEVGKTVLTTEKGHTRKAYLSSQGMKQELEACTSSFLINNPEVYAEFNDGINFLITNMTEGWDLPIEVKVSEERVIKGRSILRCVADNY